MWTSWVAVAAFLGAIGVGIGAFGAHALKDKLSPEYLAVFETGVRYQMYHVMALLAVGLVGMKIDAISLKLAGWFFTIGIFIFSGSLYALTLTGQRMLGMITPVGGLAFIAGWVSLGVAVLR